MSKIKISLFVTCIIVALIITAIWFGSFVYAIVLRPPPSSFLRPGDKAIRAMEVIPTEEATKWKLVKTEQSLYGEYQGELPADDIVQYAVEHPDHYIKINNSTDFPVKHQGVYNTTKSYHLFHCIIATQHIDAIDPATFKEVDVTAYLVTLPVVPVSWASVVWIHRRQQRKKV